MHADQAFNPYRSSFGSRRTGSSGLATDWERACSSTRQATLRSAGCAWDRYTHVDTGTTRLPGMRMCCHAPAPQVECSFGKTGHKRGLWMLQCMWCFKTPRLLNDSWCHRKLGCWSDQHCRNTLPGERAKLMLSFELNFEYRPGVDPVCR